MGNNLFDVLKGLEKGIAEGDAQLGRARRSSMEEEETTLKNALLQEQLKQLQRNPEMEEMDRIVEQEKQMVKAAGDEIKRIDQELKILGMFGNFEYKKKLNNRKRELLKFLQEMSSVPDLSESLMGEGEEEEEQGEMISEESPPQEITRPSKGLPNHHRYTLMKGRI